MLVPLARADFEQVALRPRHSPFPMLPVEEAMETVLRHTPSMAIIEVSSLQGVPTDLNPLNCLPPISSKITMLSSKWTMSWFESGVG